MGRKQCAKTSNSMPYNIEEDVNWVIQSII